MDLKTIALDLLPGTPAKVTLLLTAILSTTPFLLPESVISEIQLTGAGQLWLLKLAVALAILLAGACVLCGILIYRLRVSVPVLNMSTDLQPQIEKKIAPPPPDDLDKIKEEILQILNSHPDTTTQDMGKLFELTKEGAKFHLDIMRKAKLVKNTFDFTGEHWHLDHEGRAYLHNKKLLK